MTENALTANGGDTRIRMLAWRLLWGTVDLSEPDILGLMAWPQSTIRVDTSCPVQSPSETIEPVLLELGHWCRELFGLIPVILCRLSPDGAFLFVNDAISKVSGYQPRELLGKNWRDVFLCSDQCGDANDLRLLLSSGDVADCEMTLMARDRSARTVSWSFYKRLGPDGTLESVIALGLDITDRKRLEQALQQSEESIKGVLEHAAIAMALVAPDGRFLKANRAFCRVFGYSEQELLAASVQAIVTHPGEPQIDLDNVRHLLSVGAGPYQTVKRCTHRFGHELWVSLSISIVRDAVGRPLHFVAEVQDVTEHKRPEEAIERVLARVWALAQLGHALVSELELARISNVVMKQSLKTLRADAAALWIASPGRRELSLIAHCNLDTAATMIRQISYDAALATARAAKTRQIQIVEDVFADENPQSFAHQLASRSGMRSLLALPLIVSGKLVGILTYLFKGQRRFSSIDLEISAVLAGMFSLATANASLHRDLRNRERQVSTLLKAIQSAEDEERDRLCLEIGDRIAQMLTAASQYLTTFDGEPHQPDSFGEHAHSLVTLLRDAVQEARDVIASLRPAALDALGLVEMLRSELADIQARTALQIDFYAEQMRLPKEIETALHRVIREAVDNIVKYAHARRVVIRIRGERGSVAISIQDDGVGFDASALQHQPTPKGVGLLNVRKHVELLGGSFTIESNLGKGTRLCVQVPVPILGDNSIIRERGPHQTYLPGGGNTWSTSDPITVLVADHHELTRQGLRAMIEASGAVQVIGEAANGLEALDAVAELRPRIVLMDVRLPDLDGLEATRQVKAKHPTTEVIVMTDDDEESLLLSAVQAGAAGYLLKDVTRELLNETIRAVAAGGVVIKAPLLRRALSNLTQTRELAEAGKGKPAYAQRLTHREKEVLKLLAEGWTNKEIGNTLVITEVTVKKHVQSIIAKLGASDRTHAAILALRSGLIE